MLSETRCHGPSCWHYRESGLIHCVTPLIAYISENSNNQKRVVQHSSVQCSPVTTNLSLSPVFSVPRPRPQSWASYTLTTTRAGTISLAAAAAATTFLSNLRRLWTSLSLCRAEPPTPGHWHSCFFKRCLPLGMVGGPRKYWDNDTDLIR